LARPRGFEEAAALDAAVDCFWRNGRQGASVRDLASDMGINGPSLYNAFGDKRALFSRALERYVDCFVRERIARLEREPSAKAAVGLFFDELIARSIADPEQRGCLLINAALEISADDPAHLAEVQGYLGEIRSFFSRAVERAVAAGECPATLNPQDMGHVLLAVVIGLRVTARFDASAATLNGVTRPVLALLDHPSSPD